MVSAGEDGVAGFEGRSTSAVEVSEWLSVIVVVEPVELPDIKTAEHLCYRFTKRRVNH